MFKYLFFILFLSIIIIGNSIFQFEWLKKNKASLKEEILREWRKQKEIEDRIKEEVEVKRKTQELLLQLDYEKKLVESTQDEIAKLKKEIEDRINNLKNYFSLELENNKNISKEAEKKISSLLDNINSLSVQLSEELKELKQKFSSLNNELERIKKEFFRQKIAQRERDKDIENILLRLRQIEEEKDNSHLQ